MDPRIPKALLVVAGLALGAAGCAHLNNEDNASSAAALSDPGHVVSGGSTAGTLSGAAIGGIVGHEASRP